MALTQSAPELRLEHDEARLRLEDPRAPTPGTRMGYRAFLVGGPLLLVGLVALQLSAPTRSQALGCLFEALTLFLALAVAATWVTVLAGGRHLRTLEIERKSGRLRARTSPFIGFSGRLLELDADSIRNLRLETHLGERAGWIRWGEAARLLREHWGEKEPPTPDAEREVEEAISIRTPVLRLTVESDRGTTSSLFRVEGVTKGGQILELLERIAEALGLPGVDLEWSDQRTVSVRAGWESWSGSDSGSDPGSDSGSGPGSEPPKGAPAEGSARFTLASATFGSRAAGASAGASLPVHLPSVAAGYRMPAHRVLEWEPGWRIVFRRRFGRVWTAFLFPIAVVTAWPVLAWLADRGLGFTSGGSTPDGWSGAWLESWPLTAFLLAGLVPACLVTLWLCRPRRSGIDWTAGIAWRQGSLRRHELTLSRVEAVRLRETHPTINAEAGDPERFTLELVPREGTAGKPLQLIECETSLRWNRHRTHRLLAPVAVALARALDVPCRMQGPGEWEESLR